MKKSEILNVLDESRVIIQKQLNTLFHAQSTMQTQLNKIEPKTNSYSESDSAVAAWWADVVDKEVADAKALAETRVPTTANKLKRVTFTHESRTRDTSVILVSIHELRRLNDLEVSYKVMYNIVPDHPNLTGIQLIPYYTTDNTRALTTLVNQLFAGRFKFSIMSEYV